MVFAGATYKLHLDMKLLPIYRNSAIWTPLPGRETARPSTGTCKNHATVTLTATNQTAGPLGGIAHNLKQ